jgi:DNA-binding GntR family transcriptional regulator
MITLVRQHERMEFDPDSSDPKWRQILGIIREGIADGTYAPGSILPSIERIRQEYGVARNTARMVLDALVDEGLAYTEPGKGTYVKRR